MCLLFPEVPLVFVILETLTTEWSFPDEAVSHGKGVRQGPKTTTTARTQKIPTGYTNGYDIHSSPPVKRVPE